MPQEIRISELHKIGTKMSEHITASGDRSTTFQDLYNVAVQVDANFSLITNEVINLRGEMSAEFKAVRSEMQIGFERVDRQFERVAQDFVNFRAEIHEDLSEFKSSIITWVATFGVATVSIVSGLGIALLLKL